MNKYLKCILIFCAFAIFIESCKNKNVNDNESIIRTLLYSTFYSDPLSSNYIEYPGWKPALYKSTPIDLEKINIKMELYSFEKTKKNNIPYKIVAIQGETSYFFPINDWYYYLQIANYSRKKNNDSLCNKEVINYFYNNISFEKHLNYIYKNFKSFSDTSLSKQNRKVNAVLFVESVLNNFLFINKIENTDSITLNDKLFLKRKDCLYYKEGTSIFELYIYFEKETMNAKFKLLNIENYQRFFW